MATTSQSTPSNLSSRRNKPGKPIPRLPLSAFSPPNSGTGEKFPLPPSPKTVHPTTVYDHVVLPSASALNSYSSALGSNLSTRLSGIVVSVPQDSLQNVEQIVSSSTVPIVAVSVPLSDSNASAAPSSVKVVYNTTFSESSSTLVQAVKSALDNGAVEIDVQCDLSQDAGWEMLEDFLTSVLANRDTEATKPAIILSNILPPPRGLELATVTLINHPSYQNYQNHTSAVSFNEPVYIRFSPPQWGAASPSFEADAKTADEWKNRIKMYLGPIIEAFGFSRIIFASSSSAATPNPSTPENWYELARESVAELGIDQEGVDAIFGGNAKAVYSA